METSVEWTDVFGRYADRMRMLQEQAEDCLRELRYIEVQGEDAWQGQAARAFESKIEELAWELDSIIRLQEQARRVLQSAAVSMDVY